METKPEPTPMLCNTCGQIILTSPTCERVIACQRCSSTGEAVAIIRCKDDKLRTFMISSTKIEMIFDGVPDPEIAELCRSERF